MKGSENCDSHPNAKIILVSVLSYFCSLGWWEHMHTSCYSHWGHLSLQNVTPSMTPGEPECLYHPQSYLPAGKCLPIIRERQPLLQKGRHAADAKSIWATPGKCKPQEWCSSNALFPDLSILNRQFIPSECLQMYWIKTNWS